ncbi:MAG TPA: type I methionyl aminopeptidase [Nitrospiria bacterium]|jgi:methionyl aminopeptidase
MIILKSGDEIEKMTSASKIVAEVLLTLKEMVAPGVTTLDLDRVAEEKIKNLGGTPAFKGYRGFPSTLCVSVNDQVVHGIPSRRVLKDGDIIGLDLGAIWEGYFGDSAMTLPVGGVNQEVQRLMDVTRQSLYEGIQQIRNEGRLSDVSHAIQTCVEKSGFSVVRDFVGHGIGRSLHEEPQVPNFGKPDSGPRLKIGMVLAVEPMVNAGTYHVKVLEDQWTVVTEDGSLSAHFEHTIALTEFGAKILTEI